MTEENKPAQPQLKPLSPQQQKVMQYLVDGLTYKEIEDRMGIKKSTIGKYVRHVRAKVGAKSLYQCIAILVCCGKLNVQVPTSIIEK